MDTLNYGVIELDSKTLNDIDGGGFIVAAFCTVIGVSTGVALGVGAVLLAAYLYEQATE